MDKDDKTGEVTGPTLVENLKVFGQNTTVHGIKQISESGHANRKVTWLLVVIAAFAVFGYAISTKLTEYYEFNSQIEMLTSYEKSIAFPRVTVCNTSPYKMTSVMKAGLYDTLVESVVQASTLPTSEPSGCAEHFILVPTLCLDPDQTPFIFNYIEVTNKVCSKLCIEQEPTRCAGYLYDVKTRTCILSSATENTGSSCSHGSSSKYYMKERCVELVNIFCGFEPGSSLGQNNCKMSNSLEDEDEFLLVEDADHTIGSDAGHYLYLLDSNQRSGYRARIVSPFVYLSSSCIQVFFKHSGNGEVNMLLRAQNLSETYLSTSNSPGDASDWRPLFVNIPYTGIYQVIVEAVRQQPPNDDDSVYSGVSVDDLRIMSCSNFQRENCRTTWKGEEYMGSMTTTQSGAICRPWNQSLHLLDGDRYYFQNIDDINSNFCRNPTSENTPPWCFVGNSGKQEPCNIPACLCEPGWVSCSSSGFCIPKEFECNGNDDCYMGTDETDACESSMECGFEHGFLCGYFVIGDSMLTWTRYASFLDVAGGNSYGLHLKYSIALPGSQTVAISPYHNFDADGAVSFYSVTDSLDLDWETSLVVQLISADGSVVQTLTIIKTDQSTNLVCVPAGRYSIQFLATLGITTTPDIVLDNIAIHTKSEVIQTKAVLEYCKNDWPVIQPAVSRTALHCYFDGTDCGMFSSRSSNTRFNWKETSARRAESDVPVPPTDACFATYSDPQATTISTPGYPRNYPNNIDCYITIRQNSAPLSITFTSLSLEDGIAGSCWFDYVEIYDAFNTSNVVLKYCGSFRPPNVTTYFVTTVIHFHSDYSIVDKGYLIQFSIDSGSRQDPAYALSYSGGHLDYPLVHYLALPRLFIRRTSCLSFELIARHQTVISRSSSLLRPRQTILMQVHEDYSTLQYTDGWLWTLRGLGSAWHHVTIQLSPTANNPTFITVSTEVAKSSGIYASALKRIQLVPGDCEGKFDSGSVDCDFTSGQCGYIDLSEGPNKWLRGYNTELRESRLFVILDSVATNPATFITPPAVVYSPSCLNLLMSAAGQVITLTVSIAFSPNEVTKLRQFELADGSSNGTLMLVNVDLVTGVYRVQITADGQSSSATIQTVFIVDSPCSVVLPPDDVDDGDDDDDDDGEGKNNADVSVTASYSSYQTEEDMPTSPTTQYNKSHAAKHILLDLINDQDGEDVFKLIVDSAPTREDTILRCLWNGEICNESLITEQVTDSGQCFVFNSDPQNIQGSTQAGSEKGLQLVLNQQYYENIDYIATDRGFKVLLDHQDNEQDMRQSALSVGPGRHYLIPLTYTEQALLVPPWGTCGEVDLPYYVNKTYTFSRCSHSCAIRTLQQECHCGDAYMADQTQVCDMRRYLDCILPARYSANVSPNNDCQKCVSACLFHVFDTSLSSSVLTSHLLDRLSDEKQNKVRSQYQAAIELKQRVSPDSMLAILQSFKRVNDSLKNIDAAAEFKILNCQSSTVGRAEQVVKKFENSILDDMNRVYKLIDQYQTVYDEYISSVVEAAHAAILTMTNAMVRSVVNFERVREYQMNGWPSDPQRFWDIAGESFFWAALDYVQAIQDFMSLANSPTFVVGDLYQVNLSKYESNWLPHFLAAPHWKYSLCREEFRELMRIVTNDLEMIPGIIFQGHQVGTLPHRFSSFNMDVDVLTNLVDHFNETYVDMKQFVQSKKYVGICTTNYREFLDISHRWHEFRSSENLSFCSQLDPFGALARLRRSAKSIQNLYNAFARNEAGVIDLGVRFNGVRMEIEDALLDLESRLNQQLLNPLLSALDRLEREYLDHILRWVDDSVLAIAYMPQQVIAITQSVSAASLWQGPMADLNSKTMLQMTLGQQTGPDLIGLALDVFRNTSGEDVIRQNLRGFFSSVVAAIQNAASEQLSLKNEAVNALYNLSTVLNEFNNLDILTNEFTGENIMEVDIYYRDLSKGAVIQKKDYDLLAFFSDFGGYMGLLLGASIISLVELIDWIIFQCLLSRSLKKERRSFKKKATIRVPQDSVRLPTRLRRDVNPRRIASVSPGFTNGVYIDDSFPPNTFSMATGKTLPKSNNTPEFGQQDPVAAHLSHPRAPDYTDEFGNNYYT